MKIVTEEEMRGMNHATVVGGAKGFVGGLAFSLPASYLLNRRWPYYRSLPLGVKALGVVSVVVPAFVICAEKASHAYERQQWKGFGKEELDRLKTVEELHWDSLSTKDKVNEWAAKNKWGIILGSWAATMAGSFGMIMRDKHQTFPQKLVQARMWAQGLTIGVIIGSAVLTAQSRKQRDVYHPHSVPDHSWADAVAAEAEHKKRTPAPNPT
ncbi:hypothetical protein M422DRAFT_260060 [Sphaerobolus stellatus SS14]|uniref:HIG1 domain-containing protein n=1 Tax=Sphaerobolus stellatus (strain SS14) TaxID=990650 RepID=A0A0C9V794_SPHS4|nr:hypothetical protein M422DRAFT_260060 [Sphaerobolus stellatus SS14]